MPPPSYTAAPKIFIDPLTPPLPITSNQTIAPQEWNGNYYWFVLEVDASLNYSLVVYKSIDKIASQPLVRIAPGSPILVASSGTASPFYKGTGSVIWMVYALPSTFHVSVVSFDMATETFGTPRATGLTNGASGGAQAANDNLAVFYGAVSGPNENAYVIVSSDLGLTWSSAILIGGVPVASSTPPFDAAGPVSGNLIGIFWNDAVNDKYSTLSGTTIINTLTITACNNDSNPVAPSFLYQASSDTAVLAKFQGVHRFLNLFLVSPSDASGSSAVTTVYDDAPDDFNYTGPIPVGNAAGTQFYVLVTDNVDDVIHIFASTALNTGWTGPTVFYDPVAHPTVPADNFMDSMGQATIMSDGSLVVTGLFNFTALIIGAFCGVPAAMRVTGPAPTPPTLTCPITNTATINVPYSSGLIASGGLAPYVSYQLTSGSLPPGFSLNGATGVISGTTSATGTFIYSATVTDSNGLTSDPITCMITVSGGTGPAPPPCAGVTPAPETDSYFELRKVLVAIKPAKRLPVRGKS